MTKLERLYGIKVYIDDNLEAFTVDILEERAFILSKLKGFSLNDFNIYYHRITIENQEYSKHFSKKFDIKSRIKMLDLIFKVNEKQQKHDTIMFFNFLVKNENNIGRLEYGDRFKLVNRFTGAEIEDNEELKTELITFVRTSDIRRRHKKIKVSIMPEPTIRYLELLRKKDDFNPTDFDIPLTHEIRVQINQCAVDSMNLESILSKQEHRSFIRELQNSGDKQLVIQLGIILNKMEKSETYNNTGQYQITSQGSNSINTDITQNQANYELPDDINYAELSKQLADIKEHMQHIKDENDHAHLDAISCVIKAEKAVQNKERSNVVKFLKEAGVWALNAATDVGAALVAEIMKKSMGYVG